MEDKLEMDFTISTKTAEGMCKLLTDFLNEHWDMDIETILIHGDNKIYREVRLTERS